MTINNFLLPGAKFTPAYEVANSCRFNRADTAYMHKTPSSTGNRDVWSWSAWIKRSTLGALQVIFEAGDGGSNYTQIAFNSSDQLDFQDDGGGRLKTNRLFRDVSAWYHLLIVFNSADGTAGDRMRIYVNGTEETSFATDDTANVAQNEDSEMNLSSRVIRLGYGNEDDYAFGGYMAEVVLLDGTAATPTSFGEFDEDTPSVFKPKDVSGLTFGTNGFYLDFEASGNLGNDANGGTDLTEVNLAATDQATDTPTNNFCVMNPIASQTRIQTLSEGNLRATYSSGSNGGTNWATIAATAGKWYAECLVNTMGSNGTNIGVLNVDSTEFPDHSSTALGADNFSAGYYKTGILYRSSETNHTGNTNSDFDSYDANDIISIAMDLDNGFFYWAKNGTWQNSGDPTSAATGTGGVATSHLTASETYTFTAWIRNGSVITWNFGNPPTTFSISSGNADADGYGNFEYAPPSGYFALCTKNLAEYG